MLLQLKKRLKKITTIYRVYCWITGKVEQVPDEMAPDMISKRQDILDVANANRHAFTFIETGTFFGETVDFFKYNFKKLYSIELSKELADKAAEKFKQDGHIQIVQGNSKDKLEAILSELDETCLFWLDGHYSSEFWIGDEYIQTAKADKTTPILEELSIIAAHKIKDHVILIDDARLFTGINDYPKIKTLQKFIAKKFPGHTWEVKLDIIRVLPASL